MLPVSKIPNPWPFAMVSTLATALVGLSASTDLYVAVARTLEIEYEEQVTYVQFCEERFISFIRYTGIGFHDYILLQRRNERGYDVYNYNGLRPGEGSIIASYIHAAGGLLALLCMMVLNWFYFMAKKKEAAERNLGEVLTPGIAVINPSRGDRNEYV